MAKKKETNKIPIGTIVTLPKNFTYGGRLFFVDNWFKTRGYKLRYVSGKLETLEWFGEEELIVINKKDIEALMKN